MTGQSRSIELSVEVKAGAEAVWKALTDGEELSRWFAPEARVRPGAGGSMWLSWGPGVEGEGTIEVWEPNRHLRVVESSGMAVDYFIEKSGSAAVLRVVQSGFGADAAWDDMYEASLGGWAYFLFNMQFYLERHAGEPRHMISLRHPMPVPREEAWPLLLGKGGLALQPAEPAKGQPFRMRLAGRSFSGEVVQTRTARNFGGTITELNDGLLFLELESGQAGWHCGIWLSVYGAAPDAADLQKALKTMMTQLFPLPASV